jgi:pimeloyl-ACP methyl ester carboxylesterase
MPLATGTASRREPACPSRLILIAVAVVIADAAAASAGEGGGDQVIPIGSSELRFATRYQAGKVPVVFIHGLLGSPINWSVMIDRLSAEPVLRDRFQFAPFGYDSLQSIPESGLNLVEALKDPRCRFDPEGFDPSFDRVVLVGHSLGGLVAKTAPCAGDSPIWSAAQNRPGNDWRRADPRVGRHIFVATPHRGAPFDRGAVLSVGSWLAGNVKISSAVRATPLTSIDQLTWEHPLLAELERGRDFDRTPFRSIIAALRQPLADGATDGVVPVASAQLDGAESEVFVRTHH